MPSVTAATLIDSAATALQDASSVRWPRAELLGYLNDGQRETVIKKPNAYVIHSQAPLIAGSRQRLPSTDGAVAIDPIQLLDVPRNSTGRVVRLVERDMLDALNPDWHSLAQTLLVQHYCYAATDPKTFWVYPPNNGLGCVDVTCSAAPPAVATEGALIALDDIYQGALLDYVIYRAWKKDAEYAADPARAAAHYASFAAALGAKTGYEAAGSPTALAQQKRP